MSYHCDNCGRLRSDSTLSQGSLALAGLTRARAGEAVDLLPEEDLICTACEEAEITDEYEDDEEYYIDGSKIESGYEIYADGVLVQLTEAEYSRHRLNY